jgi:hypothetical protein
MKKFPHDSRQLELGSLKMSGSNELFREKIRLIDIFKPSRMAFSLVNDNERS